MEVCLELSGLVNPGNRPINHDNTYITNINLVVQWEIIRKRSNYIGQDRTWKQTKQGRHWIVNITRTTHTRTRMVGVGRRDRVRWVFQKKGKGKENHESQSQSQSQSQSRYRTRLVNHDSTIQYRRKGSSTTDKEHYMIAGCNFVILFSVNICMNHWE